MKQIKIKAEPQPVKRRYQNKVVTQGDRVRFTPKQKLDFITEFERLKKEEPSLTQSAFCGTQSAFKRRANNPPGPPPGPPPKRPRIRRE